MWDQEKKHLNVMNKMQLQHHVRPTILWEVAQVAGYGLGVVTALMGREAAMACTEAVETVIGEHYQECASPSKLPPSVILTFRLQPAQGPGGFPRPPKLTTIERSNKGVQGRRTGALGHRGSPQLAEGPCSRIAEYRNWWRVQDGDRIVQEILVSVDLLGFGCRLLGFDGERLPFPYPSPLPP